MLRFWLVAVVLPCVLCQRIPENPCPDVFRYGQERGIFYGMIYIPYDGSKYLNLAVNISLVGLYDNAKLKLELLTPADEILSAQYLRYKVNFPFQNVIPKITQISYNDRIYCYGSGEPVSVNGITNLWANIVFRINQYTYNVQSGVTNPSPVPTNIQDGVPNSSSVPSNINNFDSVISQSPSTQPPKVSKETCGISNNIQELVLKGTKTVDNEYPWLVAIFHRQGVSYEFQCTANLITNRHIITAAHCVWFYKAPLIDKEDILLVLGRSDLNHWATTGAIIRTAQEVIPHPNYQQGSGHCDIAIIKMNEEVVFKPTIRPVCLWDGDTDLRTVLGSKGVVAGWGKSEEARKVVAVPRKVSMPIVSQDTCLRSHGDFRNLTSEMTFCAGNRDGSGPCSGDSGAGFLVKRGRKWYLRGVVSTALKNDDFSCNLNEYIVFSDVAKLEDWVKETTR